MGGGLGSLWWPLSIRGGGDVTQVGRLCAHHCYRQLEEVGTKITSTKYALLPSTQEELCPHFIGEEIEAHL